MNERIKTLIKESGGHNIAYEGRPGSYSYAFTDNSMEKFAELIVREMLGLLEQYSRDSFPEDIMDDFDKGYQAGLSTAQEAVKKHFGVKE